MSLRGSGFAGDTRQSQGIASLLRSLAMTCNFMSVFFKKHYFIIGVILLFFITTFLRFYQYSDRWGLAYDQAHDALVARAAVKHGQFPLLGPFSSAGAFQTGGEWYWIIMAGTALYPHSVVTPWFFMTTLYVFFVIALVFVAKELVDEQFALLVGVLAAFSPAQMSQGINLANQSPLAWFSLLAIWCSIRYLRTKKWRYLFLLSFFVSSAASIHLQGTPLIMLVIVTFVFAGFPRLIDFFILASGLLLPWLPVLLVDLQNNFYNSKNMLQYYLHDQYKTSLDVLGRRWLTYLGDLWPRFWGYVVGGHRIFGYLFGVSLVGVVAFFAKKKSLTKEWLVLLFSFVGMLFMLRYVRAPLFESYIVFLHPFIFLFSGWIVYLLYKKIKIVAFLFLGFIIFFSLQKSFEEIAVASNMTAKTSQRIRASLEKRFPNATFTIYDYQNKTVGRSYPVVLYLDEKQLSSKDGRRIGMRLNTWLGVFQLVDLQEKSPELLKDQGWFLVTPEEVYQKTEEWYKYEKTK